MAAHASTPSPPVIDGVEWSLAVRDIVSRGLVWLSAHGVAEQAAEVCERIVGDAAPTRRIRFTARPESSKGDPAAEARMTLQLDERDEVASADCELLVNDRRKSLRHAARSLSARSVEKRGGRLRSVTISNEPEAGKHDPARLTVAASLDAGKSVEDLISQALRLLEGVVGEVVAKR